MVVLRSLYNTATKIHIQGPFDMPIAIAIMSKNVFT